MFSRSKDHSSEERLSSNSQYLGRIFLPSLLREADPVLEGPWSSWDLCPTGTLFSPVGQKTRLDWGPRRLDLGTPLFYSLLSFRGEGWGGVKNGWGGFKGFQL